MNIEKQGCDLILGYLSKRIEMQKESHNKIIEENRIYINSLKNSRKKLIKFEQKHYEELCEVFSNAPISTWRYKEVSFFHSTFGDIASSIQMYEDLLETTLTDMKLLKLNEVFASYGCVEIGTGLSQDSIKKYIKVLLDQKKLFRKKFIGGFMYWLPEEQEAKDNK